MKEGPVANQVPKRHDPVEKCSRSRSRLNNHGNSKDLLNKLTTSPDNVIWSPKQKTGPDLRDELTQPLPGLWKSGDTQAMEFFREAVAQFLFCDFCREHFLSAYERLGPSTRGGGGRGFSFFRVGMDSRNCQLIVLIPWANRLKATLLTLVLQARPLEDNVEKPLEPRWHPLENLERIRSRLRIWPLFCSLTGRGPGQMTQSGSFALAGEDPAFSFIFSVICFLSRPSSPFQSIRYESGCSHTCTECLP